MGANILRSLWAVLAPRTAEVRSNAGDAEASIGSAGPSEAPQAAQSARSSGESFAEVASELSRPVKNFIFDLKRGIATKEWIEICMPVMGSVIHGAVSLGLEPEADRMVAFREALAQAESSEGRTFDRESRKLILSRFEALAEVLPETFTLDDEDKRRESIILQSLVRQIPGVGRVTFEKLHGAGLTSLKTLFAVDRNSLAEASGLPLELCGQICDKLNEHLAQLQRESPSPSRLDQRMRLVEQVRELRRLRDEFERISKQEPETARLAAEKRDCLRERQLCALQIDVSLGEIGETDLVEELRTLAGGRRIDRLERYLAATAADTSRNRQPEER